MPASPSMRPRTLGVDAERLRDAECFLGRRCESMATVVRGIMAVGGMEVGSPWSDEVDRGSSDCCRSGSCSASSESDAMAMAMADFFIYLPFWAASSEGGIWDRYLSLTVKEVPAAI